jgi:2-keto-4-pentenoate hydratase/2-oxohepta-3-ene-1,7-dioic acid hydratase in catechol pathway
MNRYRLLNFETRDGPRAGILIGETVFDAAEATGRADYASMLRILEDWQRADAILQSITPHRPGWPLAETHLHAPVLWPSAIYCAGMNYRDHAAEMSRRMGREPDPDPKTSLGEPWHFLKSPRAIADPGAVIAASHYCKQLDWEVELAAVIGRDAKNVSVERALEYVAGYTAANDLSARDKSRRTNTPPATPFHFDWIGQKSFDGACPLGPSIVPARDIPDPQNLALKLWVDDVLKQDSSTSKMIFTLAEQIAHLSTGMTLYPGDVILTGTPAGVGAGRGEFLKAGDVVKIEIENIGILANTIA